MGCCSEDLGNAYRAPLRPWREDLGSHPLPHPLAPAGPRGVGRDCEGQAGISPWSPSWGGAFNRVLPWISPAPSQAPGQACVCRGDLGCPGRLSFPGQLCLLSAAAPLPRGPEATPLGSQGADGPQRDSAAAGPKRIGAFLSTLCAAPWGRLRPDHKGRLFGCLGGTGVTADSGTLGDGSSTLGE